MIPEEKVKKKASPLEKLSAKLTDEVKTAQ